jgi:beta-phosphoglucomutase-like phosphatase (HAD superfamily)
MPGAKDILTKVKHSGIQPMVITGSGQHTLLDRLNADYPNIFKDNLIVTAFDVKLGKPNPEPYLMGMKKAGDITPEQSFVVENAPLGVKAGVAAGCFTIAVNTGPLKDSELYDSGADIVFDSMSQLADNWELILSELEKTH